MNQREARTEHERNESDLVKERHSTNGEAGLWLRFTRWAMQDQSATKSLFEIEEEIKRRADKIGAGGNVLPTYGASADGARPHVEVDARGYHYVVVERGQELRRETTRDLDGLLYLVFESVTFSLACDYELAHRVAGQDSRRLLFSRQLELLSLLSPSWAERKSRDHQRILQQNPFRDQ